MDGVDLGSAYAKVLIDESGVDKGLSSIGKKFGGLGSTLLDVGKALAIGGAGFLAFGGLAVKAASDSQQAVSQLNAVIKSTGGAAGITEKAATDLASSLQKVTRYSDETVIGAESMLLTFTNIGQNVFPEATKTVLDMSTALGQDLKSSSIQLGKALNDPIKGITALSRVGVTFTQVQKDMIESLVKAGKTEQAQKVILAELAKEFGGSAVAAGKTFAGQIDILKNRIDDFMETIGNKLLPIVTTALEGITKGLGTFFDAIGDGVDPLNALAIAIFSVFGEPARGIVTAIKQIGDFVQSLVSGLSQGVNPLEAFGAALLDAFGSSDFLVGFANGLLQVRDFLQPILDNLGAGFRTLIGVIGNLGNIIQSNGIVTAIMSIVNAFGIMFGLVENDTMSPFLEDLTNKINAFILGVQTFVKQNPEFVAAMIGIGVVLGGLAIIGAAVPIVLGLITTAVGLLTGALGILLSPLVLVPIAIAAILAAAQAGYPGGLVKLFKDATTAAQQLAFLGMYALSAASDFAKARLTELLNTILKVIDKVLLLRDTLIANSLGVQGYSVTSTNQQVAPSQLGINGSGGGVVPIPPVGGGSGAAPGFAASGAGGMNFHEGAIVINANSKAEGKAAGDAFADQLEARWRGRGN